MQKIWTISTTRPNEWNSNYEKDTRKSAQKITVNRGGFAQGGVKLHRV